MAAFSASGLLQELEGGGVADLHPLGQAVLVGRAVDADVHVCVQVQSVQQGLGTETKKISHMCGHSCTAIVQVKC